jgi:hypothetical protein
VTAGCPCQTSAIIAAEEVKGRMWWKWMFWLFVACLVIVLFEKF